MLEPRSAMAVFAGGWWRCEALRKPVLFRGEHPRRAHAAGRAHGSGARARRALRSLPRCTRAFSTTAATSWCGDLLGRAQSSSRRRRRSTFEMLELPDRPAARRDNPFASVLSVPSGHSCASIRAEGRYELARWGQLRFGPESEARVPLASFAAAIRAALERTMRMLAARFVGPSGLIRHAVWAGRTAPRSRPWRTSTSPSCARSPSRCANPREAGPGGGLVLRAPRGPRSRWRTSKLRADPDDVLALAATTCSSTARTTATSTCTAGW
jgi:hypothetical protein